MQVPYRYYKKFQIAISNNGITREITTPYYAKFLDRDISYRIDAMQQQLEIANQYKSLRLGWGKICSSNFFDFYETFIRKVKKDPYYLIDKKSYLESM